MIDKKIVTNEWVQSVKSFTVAHVHLLNGRELVFDCRLDTHENRIGAAVTDESDAVGHLEPATRADDSPTEAVAKARGVGPRGLGVTGRVGGPFWKECVGWC